MVVTFGLHFANRYPGSCDLKATLREQTSGVVGQIGLSRPVISVTRAEHPGGWADRLAVACDTRFTSRHSGGWADRLVEACDTRYASRTFGAVGQMGLSWLVIPVSRADIRGGWADRDAMSCAARTYREFDGFL